MLWRLSEKDPVRTAMSVQASRVACVLRSECSRSSEAGKLDVEYCAEVPKQPPYFPEGLAMLRAPSTVLFGRSPSQQALVRLSAFSCSLSFLQLCRYRHSSQPEALYHPAPPRHLGQLP